MPFVTRDGVRLYYEDQGSHGDPVVLIMGLGAPLSFWDFQRPALAKAHRVLLLDNRGVGRSDAPTGSFSICDMAEDVVAAMDAVGFARAHVVGYSMGGMIAQELALRHGDRCKSLVLAATFARPESDMLASVQRTAGEIGALSADGSFDLSRVSPSRLFDVMMSLVVGPEFVAREATWLAAVRARAEAAPVAGFFAQLAAIMSHDTAARLKELKMPVLIVDGDADRLVPPSCAAALARFAPQAERLTVPGRHGFNVEDPARFNAALLRFFAAHKS